MEFIVETNYTPNAMTVMAQALRKTIQKKRSRRSSILGCLVIVLGIFFLTVDTQFDFRSLLTLLSVVAVAAILCFQDAINGYFAYKRMLPGMHKSIVTFQEDRYHSETSLGSSDFPYTNIVSIVEDKDYFVFIFSTSHGQVYDKHGLQNGSPEEFRAFLQRQTGHDIIPL